VIGSVEMGLPLQLPKRSVSNALSIVKRADDTNLHVRNHLWEDPGQHAMSRVGIGGVALTIVALSLLAESREESLAVGRVNGGSGFQVKGGLIPFALVEVSMYGLS
jgi:hypothetical protein